jgi:signal transduction histidine kinase
VVGDSVIALVLALLTVGESHEQFPERHPMAYWLVGAVMVAPVVFRRRWPVFSAYLIAVGGLGQVLTHGGLPDTDSLPARTSDIALGIALYTLVVYTDRRTTLTFAGVLLVGTGIDIWWQISDRGAAVVLGIGAVLVYGFSWVLGEFAGARRAYHSEVEARLRLLETERDQQATIAVVAERTRIARELHDVVAHAVSVIVVQADGAGYAIRTDPDLAETAVRTISETGREALVELRRLLDVLRSDTDERDSRSPQPGVSVLPELVDKFRVVGLPTELTVRGDVAELPAAVGLGAYRIVQEALTNTLKHAGPEAEAQVRIVHGHDVLEVEVRDTGTLRPQPPADGSAGLRGMRERAAIYDGELYAGPAPDGGWRVHLVLPLEPAMLSA